MNHCYYFLSKLKDICWEKFTYHCIRFWSNSFGSNSHVVCLEIIIITVNKYSVILLLMHNTDLKLEWYNQKYRFTFVRKNGFVNLYIFQIHVLHVSIWDKYLQFLHANFEIYIKVIIIYLVHCAYILLYNSISCSSMSETFLLEHDWMDYCYE